MKLSTFLAGYKTYAAAAIGVAGSLIASGAGAIPVGTAGIGILVSVLATFLRSGIKSQSIETAANIVAQLAPIVAAVDPNAAKVAGVVGGLASQVAEEAGAVPVAAEL